MLLMTPKEIFSLEKRKLTDKELSKIKKRGDGYALLNNKLISAGKLAFALKENNQALSSVAEECVDGQVYGSVAYPGVVQGAVRVVLSKSQVGEVKEGEIVVAAMTTPEYMPALKKAAAFITDEGGITCHAAIVARELKKPCVIGTKIATQILKNGDMVEVDADKGIVKIVKTASPAEAIEDVATKKPLSKEAIISEIGKSAFERYVKFPEIPVLYFEATCNCYVDNPYFSLFRPEKYPNLISVLSDSYEAWQDKSRRIIVEDPERIELIMDDCVRCAKQHTPYLEEFLNDPSQPSRAGLKEALFALNAISTEIYHRFIFFTDECFETADAELLKRLPEVRMQVSEEAIAPLFDCFAKLLSQVSAETGKPLADINRLTSKEIMMLIDRDSDFDEEAVDRPAAFVTYGNALSIHLGKDAAEIRDVLLRCSPENALVESAGKNGIIGGVSAHRGRAQGRVVLLKEGDYSRASEVLKEGKDYVLVTPMTRPELVPLLKAAAAIVTDEGGVTCHAAIVARELKKPCVIGTKVATSVLKDGDLVEVDADNGIVKLLRE
jgi:phosphohistidine swiveling domain-containing protein